MTIHKGLMRISMAIAFAWVFVGCSTRIADFTMLSDQNLDFEHEDYEVDKTRRVSGTDTAFLFAIIPFGLPDATTAVADVSRKIPGCVGLANVGVKANWFWLGLGYFEIEAIGYPIIKKGGER